MVVDRLQRRIAAILAADVVGFSRLTGKDEEATLATLKAYREVTDTLIAIHSGRIFGSAGDSVIAEFASPVEAVRCATEIQLEIDRRNTDVPEPSRMRFRIGINLGDVVVDGEDLLGDGVNVAARLEQLSPPGGVLVSGTVFDQLKGTLAVPLDYMGEQQVKNISVPVRTYSVRLDGVRRWHLQARRLRRWLPLVAGILVALLLLGGGFWWFRPTDIASAGLSIAVLPFDDFSGDDRQARVAEAFTEDIITELARSRLLKVIARNSVESYKDKAVDVREVARDLRVSYVLEGSLELQPPRMRVTAQLIDAGTGAHIWTERYDRSADDLFVVRDEILTRLVGTLIGDDGPLWTEWIEVSKRRPPGSLQAFDYLLLAQEPYRRRDKNGNAEARRLLEKAVELDPQLARAWNSLGNTHMQDAINGWTGDRAGSWQLYRDATQRAAELDPADGTIQVALGVMYFERGEVELGSNAWERALALAPNDALVNRAIGTQLPIALGTERAAEGVKLVERALYELDPLHPPFQWLGLGIPLYFAGRYLDAIEALQRVPDPWLEVHVMLTLALAEAGLAEKARAQAQVVLTLDSKFSAEGWIANDFYQPGGSSALLFLEGARQANLPVCASATEAAKIGATERLAECEGRRADG
jgi:TolB-like protein/class 3 adenylate cyclase/Tfp pilus assembly protein PilF